MLRLAELPIFLSNVEFDVDIGVGWVTGENGTILRTKDGGTTWKPQTSGTDLNLFGLEFTDNATGWATGLDGLIINTKNGGAKWAQQNSTTDQILNSVEFVSTPEPTSFTLLSVAIFWGVVLLRKQTRDQHRRAKGGQPI